MQGGPAPHFESNHSATAAMLNSRHRPPAPYLCLLNCADGSRAMVETTPFMIGASAAADFRTSSPDCPAVLCTVHQRGDVFEVAVNTAGNVLVDGAPDRRFTVSGREEHTLVAGGEVLAFK